MYKQLLKTASKFNSYSYRNYALRRIKEEYRKPSIKWDEKEVLQMLERVVTLDNLYKGTPNVIEK